MLKLFTGGHAKDCEGHTRREFLSVGTLAIGGLTLPQLFAARANASQAGVVRDKAVVVLFLQGGPTHIETFDPKMTAPSEYRAMFGEVKTSVPGVTIGSHFPKLAKLADRMTFVRSFAHGNGSHAPAAALVAAGGNPLKAAMGSLYSRVAGLSARKTGVPTNVVISPRAAGEKYKDLGSNDERVTDVGDLPPAFKAFDPSSGSTILQNMELRIAPARLDDRRELLHRLDDIKRQADARGTIEGADKFQQQAFDVILGGAGRAFDISGESRETIARYDTGAFAIPKSLQKKKNNVPRQSPIALGRQMLMARKLVEAGCGFVTVTSAGWDMHGNAFGINDGMPLLGPAVDKAASAFLEDLIDRGLYDDVLFVITGEFGRTPRINNKGGRDHWGNLCTLALAGGGYNMGQVIGQSDKTASRPSADPVGVRELRATVMNALFDIGKLRLEPGVPRDVYQAIDAGRPIKGLV